jgi:opacity protein-like surface antigen
MRVLITVLLCGVTPAWTAAQTVPVTLPANDTIISIGWAGAEHDVHDQRRWHGSLHVGLSGGHYWTDHLKTKVQASWNSPRKHDVYENIERQGGYTYGLSEYRAHDVRAGVAQVYQFGRNEWVHPYVGIGVDVVRRAGSLERLPQSRTVFLQNRSIPVDIPGASERKTTMFAQAVLNTGLKMYVGEKTFFDTELKLGVRRDVDHVVWTIGMGVDFQRRKQ